MHLHPLVQSCIVSKERRSRIISLRSALARARSLRLQDRNVDTAGWVDRSTSPRNSLVRFISGSGLLFRRASVLPNICIGRNGVEEEEALSTCQELLEAQCDVPVAICVVSFKYVRHALQADARLHKKVERQHPSLLRVVCVEEHRYVLRREAVSERDQSVRELIEADSPGAINIELVK